MAAPCWAATGRVYAVPDQHDTVTRLEPLSDGGFAFLEINAGVRSMTGAVVIGCDDAVHIAGPSVGQAWELTLHEDGTATSISRPYPEVVSPDAQPQGAIRVAADIDGGYWLAPTPDGFFIYVNRRRGLHV